MAVVLMEFESNLLKHLDRGDVCLGDLHKELLQLEIAVAYKLEHFED